MAERPSAAPQAGADLRPLRPDDPRSVGPYTLLGRIGAGGMGVVYGARRDGEPDTLVAVKVMNAPHPGDAGRADRVRFFEETALIQRVDAACTPRIFERGYGRRPWMAMEYVPGPTLYRYVTGERPLRGDQLLAFGLGTAEALAAIHRAGVVHLDLKPGNIILNDRSPRVLDFGLARALDTGAARSQGLAGTPGYIAPEQASGVLGPPADVFAWGAVMAFAATGRNPFERPEDRAPADAEERRRRQRERLWTLLERARRGEYDLRRLPDGLREVVARALSPHPGDRPTAAQLLRFFIDRLEEPGTAGGEGSTRDTTVRLLDQRWQLPGQEAAPAGYGPPAPSRTPDRRPGRHGRSGDALVFAGEPFTDPGRLAAALAERHTQAEEWLRGGGAARLRRWLDGREGYGAVRGELEAAATGRSAAQRAITVFAAVARPASVPRYRGVAVDADGLARIAREGPGGADRAVLAEVFDRGVAAALGRCGDPRLRRLAARVPAVAQTALDRLARLGRHTTAEHRRRARELAVLHLLGEPLPEPEPPGGPDTGMRRLRADVRHGDSDDVRDAAAVALALYPSTRPRRDAPGPEPTRPLPPPSGSGRTRAAAQPRGRAPARLFASPRQLAAGLLPRVAAFATACLSWPLLALGVGMVARTVGRPYVHATADLVGRGYGTAAAERAADLVLVLLACAAGLLVLRVDLLRWAGLAGGLAAALLALPAVPFPGLWESGPLHDLLASMGGWWGSAVAWGGLLYAGGAGAAAVRLWWTLHRAARPRPGRGDSGAVLSERDR